MLLQLLLRCIVSFAGLFLIGTSEWSTMTFGDVSFEQFVYHLRFGANGLLQTDAHTVHRFIVSALELPLLAAATVAALSLIAERRSATAGGTARQWTATLLDRSRAIGRHLHLLAVAAGLVFFLVTFSFGTYVGSFFGPDVFAEFVNILETFRINKRAVGNWKVPGTGYVGVPHVREDVA